MVILNKDKEVIQRKGEIDDYKKAKGVTKTVTKKQLTHAQYLACLNNSYN